MVMFMDPGYEMFWSFWAFIRQNWLWSTYCYIHGQFTSILPKKKGKREKGILSNKKNDHRLVISEQEIIEDKALSALPLASR